MNNWIFFLDEMLPVAAGRTKETCRAYCKLTAHITTHARLIGMQKHALAPVKLVCLRRAHRELSG